MFTMIDIMLPAFTLLRYAAAAAAMLLRAYSAAMPLLPAMPPPFAMFMFCLLLIFRLPLRRYSYAMLLLIYTLTLLPALRFCR